MLFQVLKVHKSFIGDCIVTETVDALHTVDHFLLKYAFLIAKMSRYGKIFLRFQSYSWQHGM